MTTTTLDPSVLPISVQLDYFQLLKIEIKLPKEGLFIEHNLHNDMKDQFLTIAKYKKILFKSKYKKLCCHQS